MSRSESPEIDDDSCEVCGLDPLLCQCPECPTCGLTGHPDCYEQHELRSQPKPARKYFKEGY